MFLKLIFLNLFQYNVPAETREQDCSEIELLGEVFFEKPLRKNSKEKWQCTWCKKMFITEFQAISHLLAFTNHQGRGGYKRIGKN